MDEYVAEEFEQARDALADARVLRDAGGTDRAIVNRLYYVCFHAARGVLYDRGVEPSTHQGVVSAFGETIVLDGDAPGDMGTFLRKMHARRLAADYEHDPVSADLDQLFDDATDFIEHVTGLVD